MKDRKMGIIHILLELVVKFPFYNLKMKKKIIFCVVLLLSFLMHSQNIKLEGVVKDSVGNPLEMANVIAFKKGTKFLQSYSITDNKGNYKLSLEKEQEYTLKISYLGFVSKTEDISITKDASDFIKNFTLSDNNEVLNEVEITYEMPVKIVGDTIVYNADSFTTGTEKKLEDVLDKLPGIEVDDNGEIEVEGKKVKKVLVEGKEFFDGDTKIATQNIPASAIDKVQVLKNYNEVEGMKKVSNNEDDIALNIKLKTGKDRFWFGDIKTGIGESNNKTKHIANPKLFYYSPKKSINLLGNLNNIGEAPFTRHDYYRFTGGLRQGNSSSGTTFNVSSNNLGFLTTQNNKAQEINSKFGALNFSFSPKKTWDLRGFAIVSSSDTEIYTEKTTSDEDLNLIENKQTNADQKITQGLFKISTTIKPNVNLHIDYDLFGKISKQEEFVNIESSEKGNVDTFKEEKPNSIDQNFNVYYTLNENNIFSAELRHLYQKDEPFYNSFSEVQPFEIIASEGENDTGYDFDMFQYRKLTTNKFDGNIDYYRVINNKSHLNLTLGTTLVSQNYNTSITQILTDGTINNFDDEVLINDNKYNFSDVYLALKYKRAIGIMTFEPGLSIHHYSTKDGQLEENSKSSNSKILPSMYARLQFNSSKSLRFRYNITTQFSDITKISEGYVLNNYQSLSRGNELLENALFHKYSLGYFSFSMFSFTNIMASINYTKKINAIKNNTTLEGTDRIYYPVNSILADESLSGFFRFGKTFSKWKVRFKTNFNYSNDNNIVNGENINSETFSHSYQTSFATKFKNSPNIEVGYNLSFADYSNSGSTTNRPFSNIEIPFLKSFIFTADYSYYNYKNKENTVKNTYSFLGAKLFYQKKDSDWEFIISADNLTNNKSINTDSYNEITNLYGSSLYFVQPRLLMFSVKYNL